jgi:HSP20 family molecular chaperone IbpA
MAAQVPIEVRHHRDALAVTARLSGVRAQDIRVVLTDDAVRIEVCAGRLGGTSESSEPAVVPLASPVDDRRATMRFDGDVLSLYLPKREL